MVIISKKVVIKGLLGKETVIKQVTPIKEISTKMGFTEHLENEYYGSDDKVENFISHKQYDIIIKKNKNKEEPLGNYKTDSFKVKIPNIKGLNTLSKQINKTFKLIKKEYSVFRLYSLTLTKESECKLYKPDENGKLVEVKTEFSSKFFVFKFKDFIYLICYDEMEIETK